MPDNPSGETWADVNEPGISEQFNRGMGFKMKCRYDDAIREFTAIVNNVPDFSTAHYELAKTYLLMGENREALKEFERAARFEPDNMDIQFFLRYVPQFTKPLSEELKDAQNGVDMDAGDAFAHNRLGVILLMMDSLDCGLQEIQWAVELENKAEYHLNLAYAQSLFDEGEAWREADLASSMGPENLDALLFLGALYMDLGREADAFATYEDAVSIYPGSDLLHYLIGNVYFAVQNIGMARIEIETAVKLNPDNYAARRALAELYMISGRDDKAIDQLEELVKMEPGVKAAREKLELLKAK
ncbi:tetratricopeptide repeat protein [Methanocella paludicola]|nr:tetratricopeptide repeat protein [Methanocella paludicola]